MFHNRLYVLLALLVGGAAEPDFRAMPSFSLTIAPTSDLRTITMFDPWSENAGLTSDGRCFGIDQDKSSYRLMEAGPERCAYAKPNENGFPSVPCESGKAHRGAWSITCRNLANGTYAFVAEASESTGVEARVDLLTGAGEALHFGVFSLHDYELIRVLSVSPDDTGQMTEYAWPAGKAARYFEGQARATPPIE